MPGWFRCFSSRPFAEIRLICFPHAGGSTAFYRHWHKQTSSAIEVHAVQYPGRGDRFRDPLIDDAVRLAQLITKAMKPLFNGPIALFGHSMGSLVAYEVARTLTSLGTPPTHLFVSGGAAPHDATRRVEKVADADEDTLIARLYRLGGTETDVLADPQVRELFLPYVRNDLRLFEGYQHREGPPLTCPITAVSGDDDNDVTPAQIARWGELTQGEFAMRILPGGHFYLIPRQADVLAEIHRRLGVSSLGHPTGPALSQ